MSDKHLVTDALFPVTSGTLVYLGCEEGFHFTSGSSVITCVEDRQYNYTSTPVCSIGTYCTKLVFVEILAVISKG